MPTWDSTQNTLLSSGEYAPIWMVELDFSSGTFYACTWNDTITYGGHDYLGWGNLLVVSSLKEKMGVALDDVELRIPCFTETIALTLGGVEGYRGRPARLYLALIDKTFQMVGAPKLRFTGEMQPVKIQREPSSEGSSRGSVTMSLTRAGMGRSRRVEGSRLTDAQQRTKYPGDTGLRYLRSLINNPTLWLSKEFQKQ